MKQIAGGIEQKEPRKCLLENMNANLFIYLWIFIQFSTRGAKKERHRNIGPLRLYNL